MTTQIFSKLKIGQWELENLYKDTIDNAMNQNAGLAIVKLRKLGFNNPQAEKILNDDLNRIMINARREMRKRLQDFFEAHI